MVSKERQKLIENAARRMKPDTARLVDTLVRAGAPEEEAVKLLPLDQAEAAISSIFAALQEPTEEMLKSGQSFYTGTAAFQAKHWRAMLNASPLGEKAG